MRSQKASMYDNLKNTEKYIKNNSNTLIDVDMDSYIESLSNNLTKKVVTSTDWKEVFDHIKQTLMLSSTENLLNCFILLERLAEVVHFADFEIKSYYNNIFTELLLYFNSPNQHFKTMSRKIITKLVQQEENIEFLLRFLLLEGIESNDFNTKLNSLGVLKLLFEENFNYFVKRINYSKKIIESLIHHSHDKSDKLSSLAVNNLKDFIAKLPNYAELSKSLSYDILNEIQSLSEKEKLSNKERMEEVIQKSINKQFINNVNEDYNLYSNNNNIKNSNKMICINGFYFGVFQQIIIEGVDVKFNAESRIAHFEKIKQTYENNKENNDFLKFISTFYNFIVAFIHDKVSIIAYMSLIIIDSMISYIPGVSLVVNIYACLGEVIKCLDSSHIMIKDQTKEILKKIMMILPTSTVFSFLVNNLDNSSWFLVSEVLICILYMFQHLNEIYNDLDFSNDGFDVSSFIKILNLFRHPTAKVRITAKKVIKFVGENIVETQRFLDTLENVVSEHLFSEIKKLFSSKHLAKEVSNYIDYFANNMNVASSQMIKKLKEEIDLKSFNEDKDNDDNNEEKE